MSTSKPWYGFLYYLLGARGSFFAWVVCGFGVFLTYREAVLYALNPQPEPRAVPTLVSDPPGLRRWVKVEGTEVDLGRLFTLDGPPGVISDTVLLDRQDPAAQRLANLLASLEDASRADDAVTEELDKAIKKIHDLLLDLRATPLKPREALVIVDAPAPSEPSPSANGAAKGAVKGGADAEAGATAAAGASTANAPPEPLPNEFGVASNLAQRFRRRALRRAARVHSAVRPGMERIGMLTPLPAHRGRSYRDRYGVVIGPQALVVGLKPSQTGFFLFIGFASVLLFLIIGLFALRSEPEPPPSLEPLAPES
ncbi:MAG: hypothetical protein ACYTFT_13310 [Planctomycetota bacterium]